MWEHFAAPENLAYHRLFFEVSGLALSDRKDYASFCDAFESDWTEAITQLLVSAGAPQSHNWRP